MVTSTRDVKLQMVNYRVSAIGDIIKPDLAEMPDRMRSLKAFTTREVLFDGGKGLYHDKHL